MKRRKISKVRINFSSFELHHRKRKKYRKRELRKKLRVKRSHHHHYTIFILQLMQMKKETHEHRIKLPLPSAILSSTNEDQEGKMKEKKTGNKTTKPTTAVLSLLVQATLHSNF